MKLKLKVIDANATHVTAQIVEQEGFERHAVTFNGVSFKSVDYPNYHAILRRLYVQGDESRLHDRNVYIPIDHWSQVFTAIEQLNAFKHTIVIDGKTVEISEESFNALKESLTK